MRHRNRTGLPPQPKTEPQTTKEKEEEEGEKGQRHKRRREEPSSPKTSHRGRLQLVARAPSLLPMEVARQRLVANPPHRLEDF